jgi:hypothetical protein
MLTSQDAHASLNRGQSPPHGILETDSYPRGNKERRDSLVLNR